VRGSQDALVHEREHVHGELLQRRVEDGDVRVGRAQPRVRVTHDGQGGAARRGERAAKALRRRFGRRRRAARALRRQLLHLGLPAAAGGAHDERRVRAPPRAALRGGRRGGGGQAGAPLQQQRALHGARRAPHGCSQQQPRAEGKLGAAAARDARIEKGTKSTSEASQEIELNPPPQRAPAMPPSLEAAAKEQVRARRLSTPRAAPTLAWLTRARARHAGATGRGAQGAHAHREVLRGQQAAAHVHPHRRQQQQEANGGRRYGLRVRTARARDAQNPGIALARLSLAS
jgi:hypothetical protein